MPVCRPRAQRNRLLGAAHIARYSAVPVWAPMSLDSSALQGWNFERRNFASHAVIACLAENQKQPNKTTNSWTRTSSGHYKYLSVQQSTHSCLGPLVIYMGMRCGCPALGATHTLQKVFGWVRVYRTGGLLGQGRHARSRAQGRARALAAAHAPGCGLPARRSREQRYIMQKESKGVYEQNVKGYVLWRASDSRTRLG